ncbi:hypothetical protein E6C27_scaffold616G00100 [Cucumis melo var. makuwa]|uniref:Uncharacterized protein n=1 Tax=Cucumis melo var. makuwa TaxID=1194695 RepID=A0A5A7VBS7_CUCMM|nr:hypothetical protein E6C27_scaffold616G00100 [Cucumis melo var. makuwa]
MSAGAEQRRVSAGVEPHRVFTGVEPRCVFFLPTELPSPFEPPSHFWFFSLLLLVKAKLISTLILGAPLGSPKTKYVPTGSQIARVWERASSGAEAKVRAKASWQMTKSDRGEP